MANLARFVITPCSRSLLKSTDGGICLDILQNRWSPTYDVSANLTSIQSLLDESTGAITDMMSYYALPSTVMNHPTHKSLRAAYREDR